MAEERYWDADEVEAWGNTPLVMNDPVTIDYSQVEKLNAIIDQMRDVEQCAAFVSGLDEILIYMARARYQQNRGTKQ